MEAAALPRSVPAAAAQAAPPLQQQHQQPAPRPAARLQTLRSRLGAFLDAPPVMGVLTLATLYSLFGEDVRVARFDKAADEGFLVLTAITLGLFVLEMTLRVRA
jgi:hypothetical protein